MSSYRRPRHPGATVFLTVNLADRTSDLLARAVAALRLAVMRTRAKRPVTPGDRGQVPVRTVV